MPERPAMAYKHGGAFLTLLIATIWLISATGDRPSVTFAEPKHESLIAATSSVFGGHLLVARQARSLASSGYADPTPAVVTSQEEGPRGARVTVTIEVNQITDMAGVQFELRFDANVAQAQSATAGDLVSGFLFDWNANNVEGWIKVALAGSNGVDGSGTLTSIEFTLVGKPGDSTELTLQELKANDEAGDALSVTGQDGRLTVSAEATPLVRVSRSSASELTPELVRLADGRLWAVWQSSGADLWQSTGQDGGVTWTEPLQLPTQKTTGQDDHPTITETSDGTRWMVWLYQSEAEGPDLYYMTIPDGLEWSERKRLTEGEYQNKSPAIAQATDGSIWVVWSSSRPPDFWQDLWYARSLDGGASWSQSQPLTADTFEDKSPSLLRASDGVFWVVWGSCRPECGLWGMQSPDNGATWSLPALLTPPTSSPTEGSLAETDDGILWLAWHESMEVAPELRRADLFYRFSTDRGATLSEVARWTRFTGHDRHPAVASLGSQLVTVWSSDRAGDDDIWFGQPTLQEDVDPPPHIADIAHQPFPDLTSDDPVTFRARATDEAGIAQVTLLLSADGSPQPEETMYDDGTHGDSESGDGWYATTLGPFAAGVTIDYQMKVVDVTGNTVINTPGHALLPRSFEVLPDQISNEPAAISSTPRRNRAPILATAIEDISVTEDAADAFIDLSGTFADPDEDALTLSVAGNDTAGLVTPTLSGTTLILSFQSNQNGTANITVGAMDRDEAFAQHTFSVRVTAVNDSPTVEALIEDVTVDEDAADVVIDLSDIFTDLDDDALTLSVSANDNEELVTTSISEAILVLDFQNNQNGTASVTVRATDPAHEFVENTFKVAATPINDPPTVASPIENMVVDEDRVDVIIDLSDSFTDPDRETLTLSVGANDNPTLVSASLVDSAIILDLQDDQNGTANITIHATDLAGESISNTLQVSVTPINDLPTVVSPIEDVMVDEDAADTIIDLRATFVDTDMETNADILKLSVAANDNPSLVIASIADAKVILDFQDNQNGAANITVRATDLAEAFAENTFKVAVDPINDPPAVAIPIKDVRVEEDTIGVLIDLSNTFADADIATNGDALTLSVSVSDDVIMVTTFSIWKSIGLSFRDDWHGTANVTVQAMDTSGESVKDAFRVTVTPVNDAPVASDDTALAVTGGSVTIGVLANDQDVEDDSLTLTNVNGLASGTITLNPDGTVLYTPDLGFVGLDTFAYIANDGVANSNEATVTVTVRVTPTLTPNPTLPSTINLLSITTPTPTTVSAVARTPAFTSPVEGQEGLQIGLRIIGIVAVVIGLVLGSIGVLMLKRLRAR